MQRPTTVTLTDRLFPSMFQRRLALLSVLALLGMVAVGLKTAHLTVVRGGKLRAEAESRLVRHLWTPTVRGKILDRKGRVLAQDRAGYDLGIDYPVLSGEWARDRARAFVRSAYREQWASLSPEQREQLLELAYETYQAHALASRDELAALAGLTREQLDDRLNEVYKNVRRMGEAQRRRARDRELAEANERDEIVTEAVERAIERRVDQPIREERIAHRLGLRLSDEAAFRAQFILGETLELQPIPGESGLRSVDRATPRLPGVRLFDAGQREYPLERIPVEIDRSSFPGAMTERSSLRVVAEGVGAHILGWMRDEATAEDAQLRRQYLNTNAAARAEANIATEGEGEADRGEYRPGDPVGSSGIERGREGELRGLRGYTTRQVDTGAVTTIPARPGRDVTLTIDAQLQARIQAVMSPEAGLARVQPWHRAPNEAVNTTMPDGTPINGAAVVLDIDSGEILAMVSMPEFRRSDLADRAEGESAMSDPVAAPLVNRCIARPYPPGSIVKPLIFTGAVTRGVHPLDQAIACNGHLFPNDENIFRCWVFKRSQSGERWTHSRLFGHDLQGPDAIMVSCNVFFYTLGRKLGFEGISAVYRTFGLGAGWNLGIGDEFTGHLGQGLKASEQAGHAIQMGIGQGAVSWTPLHAAAAYATLARYGYVVPPTLVKGEGSREPRDLRLNGNAVAAAIEGLRRSVNEHSGTGNHLTLPGPGEEPIFNAPNVDVWGKTGTAQAPVIYPRPESVAAEPSPVDDDSDGVNPSAAHNAEPGTALRHGDHSWFVVLVGPKGDRPRFAISVIMEYAGSGGRVSGPICNQIIHALIAEGYL